MYNKQLRVVEKKITIWCTKIKYNRLRNYEIRAAFNQYLLPQIGYALPVVDIRKEDLEKLQTRITSASLHTLTVNKNFPHDIAFAGPEYLGLQIPNLYLYQGTMKIKIYMSHTCKQDCTAKLMGILKDQVELLVGKGRDPLEYPEDFLLNWLLPSIGNGKNV